LSEIAPLTSGTKGVFAAASKRGSLNDAVGVLVPIKPP
jgi:hypothetical protein